MKKIPQDIIGTIAILKFPRGTFFLTKKLQARRFLKTHKNVTTVLEKTAKFSGRLRTQTLKHLAGIKTKEATYKENGSILNFNVEETYFSPRLSHERTLIAKQVSKLAKKSGTKILVLFAGVAPYPIAIARELKRARKTATIFSNEINRKANRAAKKNIERNKVQDFIQILQGDAKKIKSKEKFDIIIMPRPNLKETFLKTALKLSKKDTMIFYHGFGTKEQVLGEIKRDTKNKIGKINIRKAGDIGKNMYRWNAEFKVKKEN